MAGRCWSDVRRAAFLIFAFALGAGCASAPKTPLFASWEPLTASIPAASDRKEAVRALGESRRLWNVFRRGVLPDLTMLNRPSSHTRPGYTYVRAFQIDSDRVAFTIVAVENERVVVRAMIDAHPRLLPSRWVCGSDWGMFPPAATDPLRSPDEECKPAPLPKSQRRKPQESDEGGLANICEIDPAACPELVCRGDCVLAKWTQWRVDPCRVYPSRKPTFFEVGKRLPQSDWAFPFGSSNDFICRGNRYFRRVQPTDEKTSPDVWQKQ